MHISRSKSFIGMITEITDINIEHKIYTNYIYLNQLMLADSDVVRGIKQINQITKSMLWMENHESESDNSNSTSDASCNLLDPCCYTIFIIRPRSYMHTQRQQPHARTLYTDWHTLDTHARTFPRNMSCLYSHVIPSWIIGTCTMSRPIVAIERRAKHWFSCTCGTYAWHTDRYVLRTVLR